MQNKTLLNSGKKMKEGLMLLFFFIGIMLTAQEVNAQVKVQGQVLDDTDLPLPGATIIETGTTNGVVTDFDGNFTIEVPSISSMLTISYMGYETKTIEAAADFMTVTLNTDAAALDEVVVIGYGQSRQRDLTGSVSAIDLDDIESQPASNIGEALQGRAAGVQVITSGQPGNNPTIRIRGIGTIGNNDPLIVVDGVPLNGGLNQVNMQDVASMQILKDASATAIYGSRGANGVVIVTTKRGKAGVGQLTLDIFSGIQEPTDMIDVLNAQQFALLSNEMLAAGGFTTNPAFADPIALGAGTDWLDALFTTGHQNNVTLAYSNGNEDSNVYTSLNFFDQSGVIINNNYRRYIFQLNSDTDVNDRLRFGNSLKVNHDIKEQGEMNINGAILSLPTQPIYRENGDFSGPIGQPIYSGDVENPIGKATIVDQTTTGYNLQGNVFGELDLFRNFTFKSLFGAEANFWYERTWSPAYSWDTDISPNAFLFESSNRSVTILWDNILTYNKEFDNGSSVTAVVGTSAQENDFKYLSGSVQNFPSESTQQINNGIELPTINGSGSEWAIFSYFARVQLDYLDKYYLTGTVRRDGSSRFGAGNKYGTFPSASAAWRISDEDFLRESNTINELKLRLGYGVTGNQEIGNYAFASAYNTNVYNFNGNFVTAAVPTTLPNTNVQWESQKQYNIGLDATLFDRAVDFKIDLYRKDTEDMLVPQSVPVTSGYSDIYVPFINAGSIRNQGVEAIVTTYNFAREDFSWSTDYVFTYNDNEVININSDTPLTTGGIGLNYNLARIQPGYPINVFYGFVQEGIFQTQAEVDNAAVQSPGTNPATSTAPGDIRFKDLNNDGRITDDDRTFIGNPNPDFTFSLNNTLRYKNFDLSIFFQGVYGNDIFNANRLYTESMSVTTNQSVAVLDRWRGPGTSNDMPRAVFGDPNNNTRPSTRYIEDGSYLRLRNVNLGYNLPVEKFGDNVFSSAKVYLAGQNLFTITDYSGFDPEVGPNGIDNNIYPVTRNFTVGINLGF
ncbi:SusC/RagA family TonB-linked outer membrane protein [Salinimicrobium sediminilitoris]|uniref:SusC/RagA family TonB-linked outer membrane protein n=1 Tax=Salinimicrobium sediminilitoris TaxID=2876715 RepID=UPI001E42FD4A|nr:TonB-dependent receptor [Salinimicrobium sediminilitoris]MCC8361359.1 TonB-dependent receptor [Salinimicrobium sediminilitoris]